MFRSTRLYSSRLHLQTYLCLKQMSSLSKEKIRERNNLLFEEEKKKQRESVGRIEKIEVTYTSAVDQVVLIMNKNISTPYDCARHISEGYASVSALALVDKKPWDMHTPLPSSCEIDFVTMKSPKCPIVNYAYWRTCSLLLGAVLESAFKDDITMHLHSFPVPDIMSGSFIYDVFLDLPEWQPTPLELRALSAQFIKFSQQELLIEKLITTRDVAEKIFQHNTSKLKQIPSIAKTNNGNIALYRVGKHVDISKGPMIANTRLIGRSSIAAVHKLVGKRIHNIYRFQGVSLPKSILLNHFAYSMLEERAAKLNKVRDIKKKFKKKDCKILGAATN